MSTNYKAIQVENLSKLYRIGIKENIHDSLARSAYEFLKSPLSNYRKYRSLYNFDDVKMGSAPAAYEDYKNVIWALDNISFDVDNGQAVGVIGRNGSGKSTLLKILSKITDPTHGRILIKGRFSSLLEVGTGFHPELTGKENVYLNGTILGMKKSEIDSKYDEIVYFSGIEKFIDTPVKRYSSGMKVRLAFSVAAHLESEILMVDEVLAVGDAEFQKKCLGKMNDVLRHGRTVIFVSHDMLAIQSLCTKAMLLDKGKILFDGSTEDVIAFYLNAVQTNQKSIDARTDRVGGDEFRFTDVHFINPKTMEPMKSLMPGQPVIARIMYNSNSETLHKEVGIGVSFYTSYGNHLFACRNKAVGESIDISHGSNYTECYFEKWPLKEGRYFFNLFAEKRQNILDYVREAGTIDVLSGDYYGFGVLPGNKDPGVYVEYKWKHEKPSLIGDRREIAHAE